MLWVDCEGQKMKQAEKFADDLDKAAFLESEAINHAVEAARSASKYSKLKATGFCNNCGSEVGNEKKFCNDSCAEDYEFVEKRKKQNVKVY